MQRDRSRDVLALSPRSTSEGLKRKDGRTMTDNEQKYERWDGVLMKPGVRVFCHDRDELVYDEEGTIVAVHGQTYDVDFSGIVRKMFRSSISLDPAERDSEEARTWRAEHSLRVFLC